MPTTAILAGIPLSVDWCIGFWVLFICAAVFLAATRGARKPDRPPGEDPDWRS